VIADVEAQMGNGADAREIIAPTILSTPGLVIDRKVVSSRRIPMERADRSPQRAASERTHS
jgi:hypothetical protein